MFRDWIRRRKKRKIPENEESTVSRKENLYLPHIREILEQILEQYGLDYGSMCLLLIDTDRSTESVFEEDDADKVLKQLSADLNFLIILTDRPVYFQRYVEKMYEETGLPVHVEAKDGQRRYSANTVLDLEQNGLLRTLYLKEPSIYLPIYKKSWKTAENLDIYVPIGYNTVIVKGFRVVEKRGRV